MLPSKNHMDGSAAFAAALFLKGETMESVVQRFLRYVSFETTSDEESEVCPSTSGQKVLRG